MNLDFYEDTVINRAAHKWIRIGGSEETEYWVEWETTQDEILKGLIFIDDENSGFAQIPFVYYVKLDKVMTPKDWWNIDENNPNWKVDNSWSEIR